MSKAAEAVLASGNPGSASPRRFSLPVSVGELVFAGGTVRPSLLTLRLAA